LVRNVDSTTKFYMYPRFLPLIIRKQVDDLSTHTTKYTSPALTQKVFANIRRVGKGFFGVEIPLFEGMLIEQEVDEAGYADEIVEEVNADDAAEGDDNAAHGDVSAAHGEVPTVAKEQSIPSPTPPTPPPQPPQDVPSTFQEIDACAALTRKVEYLEFDKVAQALEITKLKRRVKKLERRNKVRVLKLRRLQKVGTSQRVETSDDTVMDDESNQGRIIAKMDQDDVVVLEDDKEEDREVADAVKDVEEAKEDETKPAEVQEVIDVVTAVKLITEVVTAASETVTAASAIITTTEAQVSAATLTAAPARVAVAPSRRRKGVVIRDPEEDTEKINETLAERADKRRKLDEEVEELKRHLQIVPNEDDDVYTEATLLARKVPIVDYQIIQMNNKPYYKIIRADDTHQLYISFLTLLRNFDREDLKAL
nr:hypothetical protein [Tanacetum cinerariifolium]